MPRIRGNLATLRLDRPLDLLPFMRQAGETEAQVVSADRMIDAFVDRVGESRLMHPALCISMGLLAPKLEHVPVDADSAGLQRDAYLSFLARDALEELVQALTTAIEQALGCVTLISGYSPLEASVNSGPWKVTRSDTVLTVGRHPRCGLQIADAGYISRLQCMLVRARGRLVVYDMCSLMGTEAWPMAADGKQPSANPRKSEPQSRMLLVFHWEPGSEVVLAVRCEGQEVRVRVREPAARSMPLPPPPALSAPGSVPRARVYAPSGSDVLGRQYGPIKDTQSQFRAADFPSQRRTLNWSPAELDTVADRAREEARAAAPAAEEAPLAVPPPPATASPATPEQPICSLPMGQSACQPTVRQPASVTPAAATAAAATRDGTGARADLTSPPPRPSPHSLASPLESVAAELMPLLPSLPIDGDAATGSGVG